MTEEGRGLQAGDGGQLGPDMLVPQLDIDPLVLCVGPTSYALRQR